MADANYVFANRWLYKYTSADKSEVYYGQCLDYKRIPQQFIEHAKNPLFKVDETWSYELVSKHILWKHPNRETEEHLADAKTRSQLTYHEKKLIQSHNSDTVSCINVTFNKLMKKKHEADQHVQVNLLQDTINIKQGAKEFRLQKNGIRKSFDFPQRVNEV